MKILFSAAQYDYNDKARGDSFEYENFYKSLKNMDNIETIFFDVCNFNNNELKNYNNKKLIELVEKEKPDILFNVLYNDLITKSTLSYIRKNTNTIVISWFCDDHWNFDRFTNEWCWYSDYCITTDVDSIRKYNSIGYNDVILSQWGCNQNSYVKKNLKYKYEVSFVGQPHSNRREVIEYLINNGIEVQCFGYGWDKNNPNGTRVSQAEMINIFNETKINLNLSNSSVKGYPEQIKGRNFEVPACGGFLLTSKINYLEEYYKIGEEIECYSSLEDMVNKIKYYLENEKKRMEIANNGYIRTLNNHTYDKRFSEIFDYVLKYGKKPMKNPNVKQLEKAILFGTGSGVKDALKIIDCYTTEIIAYTDNNSAKWGSYIDNKKVISPNDIDNYEYDYIVIASSYYNEIFAQLVEMKIDPNRIIRGVFC